MPEEVGSNALPARPKFFLRSLDNARFRWLVLILIGATVPPAFALLLVINPMFHQIVPGDLAVYLKAASQVHSGTDPYASWLAEHSVDPTRRVGYIYPPLVAWLLSPSTTLPPMAVFVGLAVLDLIALVAFALLMARGLRVNGTQALLFSLLVSLAFFPVQENFKWGQVNLLLLAPCSVWFVGWIEGRDVLAGTSLGLSIAVKLLQAPVLVLVVLTSKFRMLITCLLTVLALFLIASPQLLPEYVTRVLPELNVSTGYTANLAPIAFFARLFQPSSAFANAQLVPEVARIAATLASVITIVVSARVILLSRHAATSPSVRSLQAACALAMAPLVSTIDWPAHLALLLIPMAALLDWSVRRRRPAYAIAVLVSWLLLGPAQQVLWTVADNPGQLGALAFSLLWFLSQSASVALFILWGATALALEHEANEFLAEREGLSSARGRLGFVKMAKAAWPRRPQGF